MSGYQDCMNEVRQKAFEMGGLEDGSYHLEDEDLEHLIRLALSQQPAPQPVAYADPQALANFEMARNKGLTSAAWCSEWMHAHQWRGEIPLFAAPQLDMGGLRAIHAMILNALDRDAAEGKAVRGEMAAELRAALSAREK